MNMFKTLAAAGAMSLAVAAQAPKAEAQSFNYHAVDSGGVTTYYAELHDVKVKIRNLASQDLLKVEVLEIGIAEARKAQQEIMGDTNVTSKWAISTNGKVLDEAVRIEVRDSTQQQDQLTNKLALEASRLRIKLWLDLMQKEEEAKRLLRDR